MTKKMAWLARISVISALALGFAGAALAQTQTTTSVDVRKFEVISVEGNQLVVRDERGTNEYTVPNDFRFTVDGKKLAVSDLKAGMKGTATVTTTTTIRPVVVTEIRKGVVVQVTAASMTVRDDADGVRKRFTQGQLNERGIQVIKDGRVTHVGDLSKGDEISATIVSQGPPVVVTEQEVEASLAQAKSEPAPAPAKTESPAPAAQPTTPASPPPPAAATPSPVASAPVESSGMGMTGYLLIGLIIVVVLFFVARRRKAA